MDEFLQSTTFHGIRYVVEKSEFRVRRYDVVENVYTVSVAGLEPLAL